MEFKCANCLQSYKNPKVLSCFHVFCEGCLTKKTMSDQKGRSLLRCPICSLATFVPANEVSRLPTVETNVCAEHESSDLKMYCTTCEKVICTECAVTKPHSDHKHDLIADAFPALRKIIEMKLKLLNDMFLSISKRLSHLESQRGRVSEKEKLLESAITNMVGVIEEALQTRKNELFNRLHATVQDRLKLVSLRKEDLTIIQGQLSSSLGFIKESLRNCNEESVMMMKSTLLKLVDVLLSEGRNFESESLDEEEFCIMLSASPQDLMEDCLEFGEIITSNDQVWSSSRKPSNAVMGNVPAIVESCSSSSPSVAKVLVPFPSRSPDVAKMLVKRLGTPVLTLSGLKGPCGVAVTAGGEVVVAEGCADCVSVFSAVGEKLRSFGKCGTAPGEFTCPCELDIDDAGNILVVDGSNRRIQKFSLEGNFLAAVGSSGVGILQFSEPDGIAINPINQKIYVVDNNTHHVQILNPDLTFHDMFGKEGCGKGYLCYPWGIACSCQGEVYITDSGNCCVQVFTADGYYLREFGRKGSGSGDFLWPTGISVSADGNIVYVSDYGNNRISVFTSDGQFLKSFGKEGNRAGELSNIRGVKVDRNGLVYVCDTDNNRVVLY